jgi:hypothetical protein
MSSLRNSRCAPNPRRTERGSAVITVLILAAITALIASSFLFRASQEAKLATRSLYQSVALNLAEAGLEEGLYAANSAGFTTANGWTLVTGTANDYSKTILSGFSFPQGTGAIYIRVDSATSMTPTVTAAGIITIPRQPNVIKQLRVAAGKRRRWANGVVVKSTLTFSGNAVVDSYDSSVGVPNAATNKTDQATVATISTALDPITVGSNAVIYGYVATGADDPVVGSGGRIYGATTPSGTLVDTSRIRHDFTANLPDATIPTATATSIGVINATISLPRVGDLPGTNGRYTYSTPSITVAGGDALVVTGPVDLVVTGDISITGNAQITVGGTGSVNPSINLYSPGTVNIAGNGISNLTNIPAKATIWGTGASTATQTVSIAGNGSFTGTVYAPNATVSLMGNGANMGAIIAKQATIGGNGEFHYDTQLGLLSDDQYFRPTSWCELAAVSTSSSVFHRDSRTPFTGLF